MEYTKRPAQKKLLLIMLTVAGVALLVMFKHTLQRLRWTNTGAHYMTEHTNIIFDLNDTLFTIDRRKALSLLGFSDVLGYLLSGKRSNDIEAKLFQVIESMRPMAPEQCRHAPMHKGLPLPLLMQDWMAGNITSENLIAALSVHIAKLTEQGFFSSTREARIITKAALMLFDPKIRCNLYRPIKRGIQLIHACKKAGYKVYLLSNMDTELINLLSLKYPQFFELFDGITISADVRAIKPYRDIYEYMLMTYRLDPTRSYLIDDEEENLIGAQKLGITGIHCNYKAYKQVTQSMRSLGLLE